VRNLCSIAGISLCWKVLEHRLVGSFEKVLGLPKGQSGAGGRGFRSSRWKDLQDKSCHVEGRRPPLVRLENIPF
jgi:hypothetical protein